MIAGPNGAGKTTAALSFIPDPLPVDEFINADEIAKGLAPLHPESAALAASKLMITRLRELIQQNRSFAFETTAAGTNYVKHILDAQLKGYEIHLLFLWLSSPQQAIKRVAERVKQGGHDVPIQTIKKRYFLGLKNLFRYYLPLADSILILDHSDGEPHRMVAKKLFNDKLQINDKVKWQRMQKLAYGQK